MYRKFLIIVLPILFFCCKTNDESTPLISAENIPGSYFRTLKTTDGRERKYIVHIPKTAPKNKNTPLFFFLHGTGGTGKKFHENPDLWVKKSDAEGFIVVHPTASVHCHFDKGIEKNTTKWANGNLGEENTSLGGLPLCSDEKLANDLEFFDLMIEELKKDYLIDKKRIYISGNSNGAGMGLRLAAERSEIFAGVAVNAGFQSAFIKKAAKKPIPLMITVGTKDRKFAEAIGSAVPIPIKESIMNEISDFIHPLLTTHSLGAISEYQYSEKSYKTKTAGTFFYNNSANINNSLKFVLIEDLTHKYDKNLVDIFWDFFKEKSLH